MAVVLPLGYEMVHFSSLNRAPHFTRSSLEMDIQWLKKCPHVSQILKDSVIEQHILNIIPNAWWLTLSANLWLEYAS